MTVTARAEGAILCWSTHPGIGSIELGEPLTTPDPEIALRIYYAQAGEELFGIARRFHVSPAQILTANGLEAGTQSCRRRCIFWCRAHKSTKNAAFSGGVFLLCRKESEKALSSLCA